MPLCAAEYLSPVVKKTGGIFLSGSILKEMPGSSRDPEKDRRGRSAVDATGAFQRQSRLEFAGTPGEENPAPTDDTERI
ncbi:MAG: hypothetical protein ACOWYE_16150 [Desulfatiglandales bacterium]